MLMRIFVFEHVAGGGEGDRAVPEALQNQGAAMWRAAIEDLTAAGCEVITTRDARVVDDVDAACVAKIRRRDELEAVFKKQRRRCDAGLIIAPESEAALAHWSERLLGLSSSGESNGRERAAGPWNMGSDVTAIRLCADKLALSHRLRARGVATPATRREPGDWPFPLIVKPRDGAGCEKTRLLDDAAARPPLSGSDDDMVFQPYVSGTPVSASLLIRGDAMMPLAAAEQFIQRDYGDFTYRGGHLPLDKETTERIVSRATDACRAVPGLHGFVGVDLILGETPEADQVIEINPRVTMSFVGLRVIADGSILRAVFDPTYKPRLRDAAVNFDEVGSIRKAQPT